MALVRRPPKGLLGGMLGLPTTPWRAAPWTRSEAAAHAPAAATWELAGGVTHVFTHFSLDLDVLVAEATEAGGDFVWTTRSKALADTPSLFRKALERAFGGEGL